MHIRHGWTQMYWDIVDQIYWAPQYIGLKSIPKKHWDVSKDRVSIPKAMTNPDGPLYRRLRSRSDFWPYIQRQEETFNHIFNLVFSIVPGEVIAEIFGRFVLTGESRDFESHGRELRTRLGYKRTDNVTATDGFFSSSDALLAVELKFNARTSLDQMAKYLMVLAAEQLKSGRRKHLSLLYIFTKDPKRSFEAQTDLQLETLNRSAFSRLLAAPKNRQMGKFYAENEDLLASTFAQLNIQCITWNDFIGALKNYSRCRTSSVGDRTIARLIDGLIDEIACHPLSGVG